MITIIGNYGSPYVRKVLAALALKGVEYEIDPIVPFFGGDRFSELSPLRRIPVLIDGDTVIHDSTVICEYLDEAHDGPALLPANPLDRARARMFEEYADSRMGDVIVWKLFYQAVIGPAVFGAELDKARFARTVSEDLPAMLDWLEAQMPEEGFLFGDTPGTADFAIASMTFMLPVVRQPIDAARYPKLAAFDARVHAHSAMAPLVPLARVVLSTPVSAHREALAAAGAPLTATSIGEARPRPSIMLS